MLDSLQHLVMQAWAPIAHFLAGHGITEKWISDNWWLIWFFGGSSVVGWIWSHIRRILPEPLADIVHSVASDHHVYLDDDDDEEGHVHVSVEESGNDKDGAKNNLTELSKAIVEAQLALESCGSDRLSEIRAGLEAAKDAFGSAVAKFQDDEDWDETVSIACHGLFQARLVTEMVAEFKHQQALLVQEQNPAHVDATAGDTATASAVPDGAEDTDSAGYCGWEEDGDEDNDRCNANKEWRKLVLLTARFEAVRAVLLTGKDRVFAPADEYIARCHDYLSAAEDKAVDDDWSDVLEIVSDGLLFARLALETTEAYLGQLDVSYTVSEAAWDNDDDHVPDSDSQDAVENMALALVKARSTITSGKPAIMAAALHLHEAEHSHLEAVAAFWDEKYDVAKGLANMGQFHAQLANEAQRVYLDEYHHLGEGKSSTIRETVSAPDGDWLSFDGSENACLSEWRKLALRLAKLQALIDSGNAPSSVNGGTLLAAQAQLVAVINAVQRAGAASPEDWSAVPTAVEEGLSFVDKLVAPEDKPADAANHEPAAATAEAVAVAHE